MKLEISKEEYRILIDMIQISEWVLHSHKTEEDLSTKRYNELEQKICSFAKEMGYEDLIEYDKELKKYFPTRKFEEEGQGMKYIDEYDNDTFWDELIDRFVEKDILQEIGDEKYCKMDIMERFKVEEPLREKYGIEFEENGFDNVEIKGITSR